MQFLSLLVVVQLIIGLTVAQAPHRHSFKNHHYQAAILLAEDVAPPADSAPADVAPADAAPDSAPDVAPDVAPETAPDDSAGEAPVDNIDNGATDNSVPAENAAPEENVAPENGAALENSNNPLEEFTTTESEVLTDTGTYTNPDNIDQTYADNAQIEDGQLAQVETPAEAVPLLIDFANENVNDIGTLIQDNDFTSANFVIQRLNDQVDQAMANIGGLTNQESAPLKQQLIKFSEEADKLFRSQQLVVPESLEQDFEISRGQFLNIEQLK